VFVQRFTTEPLIESEIEAIPDACDAVAVKLTDEPLGKRPSDGLVICTTGVVLGVFAIVMPTGAEVPTLPAESYARAVI
jgi:hypothetical protein